jgi:hypothetical protein
MVLRTLKWGSALVALILVVSCAGMYGGSGYGPGNAPGPEALARVHWTDIAQDNLSATMSQYAPSATLDWIGGPLNGTYKGDQAIKGVWDKFFGAQGMMSTQVSGLKESNSYGRATVTATVVFKGKATVTVQYTLVYEKGQIVSEVWKVA